MKIIINKGNLLFGVNAVQKAVSSKNALQILSGIHIEAKEGKLFFSATDLEIGIKCHIPTEVIVEGSIVIPARYFSEIVRKLPDSQISIETIEDNNILIKYENSELTLKTYSEDQFPSLPEIEGDFDLAIQAKLLKLMIKQTIFAASSDEARPLFTGILFEINDGKLRLIATDTHRLALRQGSVKQYSAEKKSFIVPAKILNELARLMHDEEEICKISINKNLVSFTIDNIVIICRLIEGQFPDYRQVIPTKYSTKVTAKTKNLQESVERISLFTMSNDNNRTINIKTNNKEMTISSKSEVGQGYELIIIHQEGESVEISFNARYLLDVCKILDNENISIEFTGPLSPGIIRPTENDDFIYLVLPVRS